MIKEFAIDPKVVFRSKETFHRFISDFGAEHGRVIGAIPGEWKQRFFEGINCLNLSTMAKRRAKDLISKLEETSLIKRGSDRRIPDREWICMARKFHADCNFSAILSDFVEPENSIFDYGNMLENEPSDWFLDHTMSVPRNSESLTSTIAFALSVATAPVHFVDPYFDSRKDNYVLPLRSFIDVISSGRFGVKKVFVHIQLKGSGNNSRTRSELQRGFDDRLTSVLPENFVVELCVWPDNKFHDRYVLTKQVGYSFGHGLSEADYQDAINVNVHRISEVVRKELFKQFSTQAGIIEPPMIIKRD